MAATCVCGAPIAKSFPWQAWSHHGGHQFHPATGCVFPKAA